VPSCGGNMLKVTFEYVRRLSNCGKPNFKVKHLEQALYTWNLNGL
jgi:hypothetical protein